MTPLPESLGASPGWGVDERTDAGCPRCRECATSAALGLAPFSWPVCCDDLVLIYVLAIKIEMDESSLEQVPRQTVNRRGPSPGESTEDPAGGDGRV